MTRERCRAHGRVMLFPLCSEDGERALPQPPKEPRMAEVPQVSGSELLDELRDTNKRLDELIEFCTKMHSRLMVLERPAAVGQDQDE